ncbi:hypothetical protein [Streptosporangium sp. KLBMP 9127]|nr:hypothetical protein [Streptosporangium sp. KLBMP 9127]
MAVIVWVPSSAGAVVVGCPPDLRGAAKEHFDQKKLCAEANKELGAWLETGRSPDWGRVLNDSQKNRAAPEPGVKPATPLVKESMPSEGRRRPPEPSKRATEKQPEGARDEGRRERQRPVESRVPVESVLAEKRERRRAEARQEAKVPERPVRERSSPAPSPSQSGTARQVDVAPPSVQVPVSQTTSLWPAGLGSVVALALIAMYVMRRRIAVSVGGALREWRANREEMHLARLQSPAPAMPEEAGSVPPAHDDDGESSQDTSTVSPVQEPVLEPGDIAPGSAAAYAISLAALHGVGLTGPGAEDFARAILIDLLVGSALPTEVVMPHGLARRLLGDATTVPGLVVLDSVRDVVTHVEVEIVRRTGERQDYGNAEDLPWLFVITVLGDEAETLDRGIRAGAESLVLGVMLERWPYGITCAVDADGRISHLSGRHAPPWVGHGLPAVTLPQALAALQLR